MVELIFGCLFVALAVGTFLSGLIVAIRRQDSECVGYSALGIFPLIVSIFFLTTCETTKDGTIWTPRYASEIRQKEAKDNEVRVKLSELELEKIKLETQIPVEKAQKQSPASQPATQPKIVINGQEYVPVK